ncbi:hypothetical protein jhhlp_008302 [Lomentospora prolificans]|uniref:Uncharacterized protein n=1 Tax=Lomentospora prolificans TaxID=41688 RepID=A0A2N3MXN5_9PEZI|nr:hypothetical protein jhhlp_008302 [Lomentospora prolificans]
MMRPLLALIIQFEILRRPGFHRFVGKIQRYVDEKQNGRHPDQPLHPGEATGADRLSRKYGSRADVETELPSSGEGFLQHFVSELKNQAKGNPSKDPRNK